MESNSRSIIQEPECDVCKEIKEKLNIKNSVSDSFGIIGIPELDWLIIKSKSEDGIQKICDDCIFDKVFREEFEVENTYFDNYYPLSNIHPRYMSDSLKLKYKEFLILTRDSCDDSCNNSFKDLIVRSFCQQQLDMFNDQ